MKIVYLMHQFLPEYYTGTEKIIFNVAAMMQRAGHKVKVITYSLRPPDQFESQIDDVLLREYHHEGVPVLALRQAAWPDDVHHAWRNEALAPLAARLLEDERPDLVHVGHAMRLAEFVWALPPRHIPFVVTLTDFFAICPKYNLIPSQASICAGPAGGQTCAQLCPEFPGNYIRLRLRQAGLLLGHARATTVLSAFSGQLIQKEFPHLAPQVIAPGLDVSRRRPAGDRPAGAFTVGYAGSLNRHKGVHVLVDAFRRLPAPAARLLIYGSGDDAAYIADLKAAAAGDERIQFAGVYQAADISAIFAQFDLLVIPSLWYETYCLVLHEAFACGLPVAASDVGVLAEQVEPGRNGWLFPLGDSAALAARLQALQQAPDQLAAVRAELAAYLPRSIEQEAYAYLRLYEQIAAGIAPG